MPETVLLDVDTGVDDALAIMLAIHSPAIRVVGITAVTGNTGNRQAVMNTRYLLGHFSAGESLPVVIGAARSLSRGVPDRAADVHGGDGLGGVFADFIGSGGRLPEVEKGDQDAADFILEQSERYKKQLAIVATGPVTNLALALERDRSTFLGVGHVLIMGGAVEVKGNVGDQVEFNASCDPEALAAVFESGVHVTLFPLDVTRQVRLRPASLEEQTQVSAEKLDLIRRMTKGYMEFYRREYGIDGAYMHDALPVGYVIRPDLFLLRSGVVTVDCSKGPSAGQTRWAKSGEAGGAISVALKVDEKRFLDMFWEALRSDARRSDAFASRPNSL